MKHDYDYPTTTTTTTTKFVVVVKRKQAAFNAACFLLTGTYYYYYYYYYLYYTAMWSEVVIATLPAKHNTLLKFCFNSNSNFYVLRNNVCLTTVYLSRKYYNAITFHQRTSCCRCCSSCVCCRFSSNFLCCSPGNECII